MKIRTQFILTLLFFGLILVGMIGSLILTDQRVDRLFQQEETARRIEQRASELNYLSGDYLMYSESQQRARWESSFASLSEDVSKLVPVNPQQKAIIDHIKADQARLEAIFRKVVSTLEESSQIHGNTPDMAFTQVSWSRMEVQNQSMAFEASILSQQLRDEAERLKQLNLMLMFALIGTFGAYLLTNYYLIDQRTLRSIAKLQDGTEIVGSGNLDFTIAVKRLDEIGELSHAFNQMTGNLKEVTASKADLEREIAEREQAEEALRQSEARFRLALTHAPVSVATQDRDLVYTWAYNQRTWRADEIVGKTDVDLFPAEAAYLTSLKRWALESGENLSETLWVTSNNQRLFLDLFIAPLRNEIGEIEGIGLATVDLTQIKLAEEALQEVNERLEEQAVELEMQARELQEQKNELVDANEHLRLSEELANQRFIEIQAANQELLSARLAALNLMEDALTVQEQFKQINLRLRESEQRLNRAQEIAHLGSWELDLINNQLTWSDEVYRIFGLQAQEFGATYEAFLEVVHPDDRAAVDNAYSESIRAGRDSYEIEHRVVRRSSGEVRIVYEKCEHFRDDAGRTVRSIGMVHDITARKQAEEELRVREELYRAVVDNALEAILVTNPSKGGRVLSANPAACLMFGYRVEEFTRLDREDILDTSDSRLSTLFQEREHHGHATAELTYKRKGGKKFSGELSSAFYQDKNGERRAVAIIRDITERKQAEEALRKAHDDLEERVQERTQELWNEISERREIERQLRIQSTAMEAAANGIVITDCQGNIKWTNPALTQISGYEANELIGQSMRLFRSGKQDADFYRQMWQTILAGNVWQGETTNRRKDGSLYVEEQTITPVRDGSGQISHFIAIKQDVTERKLMYAQLEESNQELQWLSTSEHQQRLLAEGLVKSSVVLNMNLELNSLLDHIFEQTRRTIPYLIADIVLIKDDVAHVARQWGFEDHPEARTLLFEQGDLPIHKFPIWERICATRTTKLIQDTTLEAQWDPYLGTTWIRSYLAAPLIYSDQVIGIMNLCSDQANAFQEVMANNLKAFAASAAVAIQNARLYEAEQQNRKVAETLSQASVALSQTLDIQHVMETILDYIQMTLPVDAAFLILSEGNDQFRIRCIRASQAQSVAMTLLNQSIDLLNEPVLKPFFEKQISTLIRDSQEVEMWAPPPELAAMRNWLGIPLISTGKTMGMVVAASVRADFFSQDQVELAEAVVSQAAVALQNAWLFEQVRLGRQRLQLLSRHLVEIQENERKYIARELHDETSQALTSLKMGLHSVEQAANGESTIVQQVAELKILADEILESLHRLAMNLRPASLDHLGLVEAITSLVASTGQRSGLTARFKSLGVDQRNRLTEEIEASVYRIIQESLTNIIRHAHATSADVILEWQDEKIAIIVEDDGVGIDFSAARTEGQLGLVGMQERAEMLGGKLLIDSIPNTGTTLVVEIPYAHSNIDRR